MQEGRLQYIIATLDKELYGFDVRYIVFNNTKPLILVSTLEYLQLLESFPKLSKDVRKVKPLELVE